MDLKACIIGAGILLGCSAIAKTTEDAGVIDSVDSVDSILALHEESCRFFIPILPPDLESAPYVDQKNVLPVDWKSFKDKSFTSQMYAEMDPEHGWPIYPVRVRQEFGGDVVFYNVFGTEALRIPAPENFDPYGFIKDYWQITELTEMQMILYPSARIELQLDLLPETFYPAYKEIQAELAAQQEALLAEQEAAMASEESDTVSVGMSLVPVDSLVGFSAESGDLDGGMAMMSSTPPPPPGGGGGGSSTNGGTSNLVVELAITPPQGWRYIEIFRKDDLVYDTSWETAEDGEWIPTYGETVYYIDPGSSNETQGFFLIGDAEIDTDGGDGRSDLYEEITGCGDPAAFDATDLDGDGMNDWWEEKLFGDSSSQAGTNDFDSDGLLNNEELVWSGAESVVMLSDPTLQDSDADGFLNDYQERRVWGTDALEKDTDSDGQSDADEVLGSPATDPKNSDTQPPILVLAGG